MPIYTDEPTAPVKPKENISALHKPGYKSPVIDTRYIPRSEIIAYIEGSTWVVDYFAQVIDSSSEVHGHDVGMPAPKEQFDRIFSLELKVTQALDASQDSSSSEMTVTGTALVYPFLTPQVGDMFRAGTPDGKEGLFQIKTVEQKSIFKDTCHEITYQMLAPDNLLRFSDLEQKTVRTFYYVRDFMLHHQNPLLIESEYEASKKLAELYYDLIDFYFRQFFSREAMTLVVPGQLGLTYDHAFTDYVLSIMESTSSSQIQSIRLLNIGEDASMNSVSIWTAMLRRDAKLLDFVYPTAGLLSANRFHPSALMAGIRFSSIRYVVYPLDTAFSADQRQGIGVPKLSEAALPIRPTQRSLKDAIKRREARGFDLVEDEDLPSFDPMPTHHLVDCSTGYVFSPYFYQKRRAKMSLIEGLVTDYIDHKLLDQRDILKLAEESYYWGLLERFYLVPVIVMLIRYHIRSL